MYIYMYASLSLSYVYIYIYTCWLACFSSGRSFRRGPEVRQTNGVAAYSLSLWTICKFPNLAKLYDERLE